MAEPIQGGCAHENVCHAATGTGYFFGAAGASLALILLATTVAAIAIGLLAWDGLFIYSVGLRAHLHLIWAIPVTLAFITIDLMIIANMAAVAATIGLALANNVKYCGNKMLEHYRLIGL